MTTILIEEDDRGVVTLTLARPEKHNAMNAEMIGALAEAAGGLAARRGLRAVVLAAEGRSFCAGGDIGWMRAQMAADRATRIAEARRLAEMLGALDRLPLPLIARVQGQALGGGVGLLAVCDAVVAAEGARFGLTETRLGLIPATIAPYVLARLGPRAREVFFSSRVFGAEEARELGLVRRVLGAEALDEAVEAELAPYLAVAPGAVADAKALFHRLRGGADAAAIEATVQALADRWETEEAQAGVEAFLARRPAPWADG